MLMTLLLFCFLLGCVDGLRCLTAPAAVCWGAHLGWLHLAGTRLAFVGHRGTVILFTLLALVELTVDKLPKTPPRTAARGLSARIIFWQPVRRGTGRKRGRQSDPRCNSRSDWRPGRGVWRLQRSARVGDARASAGLCSGPGGGRRRHRGRPADRFTFIDWPGRVGACPERSRRDPSRPSNARQFSWPRVLRLAPTCPYTVHEGIPWQT